MKTKVAMKTIPSTWIIFSINILIILIMIPKSKSDLWYWYSACDNTTMFANNSQYESNLNTLFRYLSSNATNPNGYHKAISSNGNTTNETIYGHFLCRGDANVNSCQNCVNTATTTDLPKTYCPNRKEATIWYNNCLVRYSNHLFFGRVDLLTSYSQNTNNITGNMTRFMELMRNMMVNDIGVRAAFGGSKKKFATNMVNYTISLNRQNTIYQTIYGLGQCTPDLKKIDCLNCINISVSTFFVTQGARSWTRSCVARFELYPFFDLSSVPPSSMPPSSVPPSSVPPLSLPSPPPLSSLPSNGQKFSSKVIIAIVVVPIVVVLVGLLVVVVYCTKYKESKKTHKGEDFTILESLQYDLRTLRAATDDFSNQNKLGQGGFGCVYKGTLSNGQLVAVKRLSMNSSQGLQEFKNEVLLVAKLQHRNLVRLLGFCFEGPEKLLVYEYMPNKSLDNFIFDPDKQKIFDWGKRYKNIKGIARGMMYLHHDSQLRIIHRDLKASNVLLDVDMNSKIADFGMARLFGMDQTQSNTSKVVGTYGYMSPEYILYGQISLKSDVYSFGVLILEIISGKKNSTFYHHYGDEQDLLSYAWKKWRDDKLLEFVDPAIQDSCLNNEVERCIQLGLICVQDSPNDRPTMATVVVMLDSYSVPLPVPKEPGFFMQSRLHSNYTKEISSDQSSSRSTHLSVNDLKTQSLSLQPDI